MDIFDSTLLLQLRAFAMRLLLAGGVLFGFWIAANLAQRLIVRVSARANEERAALLQLAGKIVLIGVRIFGVVSALGTVGVDVTALVAGLGLTGFALGFALKDALSNLLAGAMILFYRPFRRGSHITVSGLEGVVREIDLRYTTLVSEERTILLPNSNLLTNPIIVRNAESRDFPA